MEEAAKGKITNLKLHEILLDEENIPIIEDLLNHESQLLTRLKKSDVKGDIWRARKVPHGELESVVIPVFERVDALLGIEDASHPTFDYFRLFSKKRESLEMGVYYFSSVGLTVVPALPLLAGGTLSLLPTILSLLGVSGTIATGFYHFYSGEDRYNPNDGFMRIRKNKKCYLIPKVAHEYTHHVQGSHGLNRGTYDTFCEGHARFMQWKISKEYAEQEGNAFLLNITDSFVGELKSVYHWLCREFDRKPNRSLLRVRSRRDYDESIVLSYHGKPTPHAVGGALFRIAEVKHGEDVYRTAFDESFQFV